MIKLANGADVIACVLLADDEAGVLCLHRGEYVTWLASPAEALRGGKHFSPSEGKWYCQDGSYFDCLTKARKSFYNRFMAGWAAPYGQPAK